MSNKKQLSDSIIASILEDDLSAIESSDESVSEEPLLGDCVLDYDDEISRGLSRIFGEEPMLEMRGLENVQDPPGPRVSVEYLESVESAVTEEPVREVSTRNENDCDISFGALSESNHPTPAQSDIVPNETPSANIESRPIRVAQIWSDKV